MTKEQLDVLKDYICAVSVTAFKYGNRDDLTKIREMLSESEKKLDAAFFDDSVERGSVPEACPMCHGDGMCEQPIAAPAGVEIPKYPKIKCPMCKGIGYA